MVCPMLNAGWSFWTFRGPWERTAGSGHEWLRLWSIMSLWEAGASPEGTFEYLQAAKSDLVESHMQLQRGCRVDPAWWGRLQATRGPHPCDPGANPGPRTFLKRTPLPIPPTAFLSRVLTTPVCVGWQEVCAWPQGLKLSSSAHLQKVAPSGYKGNHNLCQRKCTKTPLFTLLKLELTNSAHFYPFACVCVCGGHTYACMLVHVCVCVHALCVHVCPCVHMRMRVTGHTSSQQS